MKKPTSKPVKKSRASVNSKLAKGAAAIRAASNKPPAKKEITVRLKSPPSADINKIIASRVKFGQGNASLTLSPDTTTGEYLAIFDELVGTGEKVQFLIGDAVNEGEKLACFGGKYAVAMAESGRAISTLKAYASAAKHIPPDLRVLPYTHCREIVKVPNIEDKRAIINDAVAAEEKGEPMTVKEIRRRADKVTPRKPKKTKDQEKHPPHVMSESEREQIIEAEDISESLCRKLIALGFAFDLSDADKAPLRDKLGIIAEFLAKL